MFVYLLLDLLARYKIARYYLCIDIYRMILRK